MSFSFHFTRKVIEVDYRLCVRRGCDTRKLEQISRQNNYRKQKVLNKAVVTFVPVDIDGSMSTSSSKTCSTFQKSNVDLFF